LRFKSESEPPAIFQISMGDEGGGENTGNQTKQCNNASGDDPPR